MITMATVVLLKIKLFSCFLISFEFTLIRPFEQQQQKSKGSWKWPHFDEASVSQLFSIMTHRNHFGIWESTKENWVITTFSCFHIWYWFLYWVNWYSWPCNQLWFNRPTNFQRVVTSSTIQHIYWPSIGINSPLNYHLINSEKAYFHCRGGAHISMEKVQKEFMKMHKLLDLFWKCDVFLEIFWYFWAELE